METGETGSKQSNQLTRNQEKSHIDSLIGVTSSRTSARIFAQSLDAANLCQHSPAALNGLGMNFGGISPSMHRQLDAAILEDSAIQRLSTKT